MGAMQEVYKQLRGLQEKFIPLARRRSKKRPKWATAATRNAMKDKMKLWKLHQRGRDEAISAQLKQASKKVYRANRKAKRDFENHLAENENRRLFYGYIKSKAHNRDGNNIEE